MNQPQEIQEPGLVIEETQEPSTDIEVKPTPVEELTEVEKHKQFQKKIGLIKDLLNLVSGGIDVSSKIDPILSPKHWKTTSNITRGEVAMCISLITFSKQSIEEGEPCLDFLIDYLMFKISESGFGIEKAIELGRALTEKEQRATYLATPEKPQGGMKEK